METGIERSSGAKAHDFPAMNVAAEAATHKARTARKG
jgi:hypothetical protein